MKTLNIFTRHPAAEIRSWEENGVQISAIKKALEIKGLFHILGGDGGSLNIGPS
jgi:hypothetical protein